jgi:hypothetical protein
MTKIAIGTVDSDPIIRGGTSPERIFDDEEQANRYADTLDWDSGRYYMAYIGEDEWYRPLTPEGEAALREAMANQQKGGHADGV